MMVRFLDVAVALSTVLCTIVVSKTYRSYVKLCEVFFTVRASTTGSVNPPLQLSYRQLDHCHALSHINRAV